MASSRRQYPFHLIEPKWQQNWDEQQAFRAFNPGDTVIGVSAPAIIVTGCGDA